MLLMFRTWRTTIKVHFKFNACTSNKHIKHKYMNNLNLYSLCLRNKYSWVKFNHFTFFLNVSGRSDQGKSHNGKLSVSAEVGIAIGSWGKKQRSVSTGHWDALSYQGGWFSCSSTHSPSNSPLFLSSARLSWSFGTQSSDQHCHYLCLLAWEITFRFSLVHSKHTNNK